MGIGAGGQNDMQGSTAVLGLKGRLKDSHAGVAHVLGATRK